MYTSVVYFLLRAGRVLKTEYLNKGKSTIDNNIYIWSVEKLLSEATLKLDLYKTFCLDRLTPLNNNLCPRLVRQYIDIVINYGPFYIKLLLQRNSSFYRPIVSPIYFKNPLLRAAVGL